MGKLRDEKKVEVTESIKWIEVKEKKPSRDCMVYACNYRDSDTCYLAYYYKDRDVFKSEEIHARWNQPPLDITHWYPLPTFAPEMSE